MNKKTDININKKDNKKVDKKTYLKQFGQNSQI